MRPPETSTARTMNIVRDDRVVLPPAGRLLLPSLLLRRHVPLSYMTTRPVQLPWSLGRPHQALRTLHVPLSHRTRRRGAIPHPRLLLLMIRHLLRHLRLSPRLRLAERIRLLQLFLSLPLPLFLLLLLHPCRPALHPQFRLADRFLPRDNVDQKVKHVAEPDRGRHVGFLEGTPFMGFGDEPCAAGEFSDED